jgi:hypothetical protein
MLEQQHVFRFSLPQPISGTNYLWHMNGLWQCGGPHGL